MVGGYVTEVFVSVNHEAVYLYVTLYENVVDNGAVFFLTEPCVEGVVLIGDNSYVS